MSDFGEEKRPAPDASREELLARAEAAAKGIDLIQDSMSLRRAVATLLRDLAAALRKAAPAEQCDADTARAAVIEECAKVLDEAAQDWNRIRDPGMANNARSYAKRIRALASEGRK